MKEQEIKETLSDIRNMMERSQKVMFLNGASGIIVAVWAFLGATLISNLMYRSMWPMWGFKLFPLQEVDTRILIFAIIIFAFTFLASYITVLYMSRRRAMRRGLDFELDTAAKQLLRTFFTVMIIGGLFCLTPIRNGHWELVPGFMLAFYGLALVVISPMAFKISITKYFGFIQIAAGLAALTLPQYGMMFWTLGFCVFHLIWGIWFHFVFDRKNR
ncbi:MAG: hypothetical protein J5705_05880 [Bacteroidaceae bacterium]|nr:hypothetical protein [Bacteroidaceae bacterium]